MSTPRHRRSPRPRRRPSGRKRRSTRSHMSTAGVGRPETFAACGPRQHHPLCQRERRTRQTAPERQRRCSRRARRRSASVCAQEPRHTSLTCHRRGSRGGAPPRESATLGGGRGAHRCGIAPESASRRRLPRGDGHPGALARHSLTTSVAPRGVGARPPRPLARIRSPVDASGVVFLSCKMF